MSKPHPRRVVLYREIAEYLDAVPRMTAKQVALIVGTSVSTVNRARREMFSDGVCPFCSVSRKTNLHNLHKTQREINRNVS